MGGRAFALACATALSATGAGATSLRDALVRAYATNPTLTGARAGLRASDENVNNARAAGRPQAGASADLTKSYTKLYGISRANALQASGGANLSVPLYSGGTVRNSILAEKARVDAGREDLRTTEGGIFTGAVAAYMDVIRDLNIVRLNGNNVKVLETNLEATRDRFQVGDVTRTDVAQSEARLSDARTQLAGAQSQFTASQENYLRVIGAVPEDLDPPPPLPQLPDTADRAVDVALDNNAALRAVAAQVKAARYDVSSARGTRLPQIAAIGNGTYAKTITGADPFAGVYDRTLNASIGLQATIPLYQGGLPGAQVRRAEAVESQVLEQQVEIERQVINDARASFAAYRAALAVIDSSQAAVSANTLALEGARAENSVGTRTVLDVLNAEQELLISQQQLVAARRDAYVAGFALLNAMGQAEARYLGLDGGPLYDPTINYNRVSKRVADWSDDPAPLTQATRTVPATVGAPQPPAIGAPVIGPPQDVNLDSGVTAPPARPITGQ